ncbi:MAG: hypothetical protein PHH58_13935 [Rhodoferax sp.]|nr:hypothetical protein [Rhodoferax sp.]
MSFLDTTRLKYLLQERGFGEARIIDLVAQCRPALPDNQPGVRWLGARTLQVNGLYRHGYLISPALHDVVLELLAQGTSALAARWHLPIGQTQGAPA